MSKMSAEPSLSKLTGLCRSLTDTKTKRLAWLLVMGYISFKLYRYFSFRKPPHPDTPAPDSPTTKDIDDAVDDEKEESNQTNELEFVPQSKGIPISEEMLLIESAGHTALNGGYRWFLHDNKWCQFNESSQHFCLKNNIPVQIVHEKMRERSRQRKWDTSVQFQTCWVLTSIDNDVIYYAAPEINKGYIPNDNTQWIAVSGALPTPQIYVNLMDHTSEPDTEEQFGNVELKPSHQETITFSDTESKENEEDNGIIVHKAHDDDDDEESQISDLDA
eukprot:159847_1